MDEVKNWKRIDVTLYDIFPEEMGDIITDHIKAIRTNCEICGKNLAITSLKSHIKGLHVSNYRIE